AEHGGGRAPRRRPSHPAPARHDRAAAPVLAADAGDLVDAVAVLAAPAQAGGADPVAPAFPRRARLPGAAPRGAVRARGGHRVLAGGAAEPGYGDRPPPRARGRRQRSRGWRAPQAPAPAPAQPRGGRMTPVVACV